MLIAIQDTSNRLLDTVTLLSLVVVMHLLRMVHMLHMLCCVVHIWWLSSLTTNLAITCRLVYIVTHVIICRI
jgi:hypothetical protein